LNFGSKTYLLEDCGAVATKLSMGRVAGDDGRCWLWSGEDDRRSQIPGQLLKEDDGTEMIWEFLEFRFRRRSRRKRRGIDGERDFAIVKIW
jgi:hypothetical protein